MKKAFLDISKLTKEDYAEIKHLMSALSLDFNQAIWKYINDNPNKIRVIGGITEEGKIHRDEITEEGVSEYEGKEALERMFKDLNKDK